MAGTLCQHARCLGVLRSFNPPDHGAHALPVGVSVLTRLSASMTYGHTLSLLAIHDRALVPMLRFCFIGYPQLQLLGSCSSHAYARPVNHCVSVRLVCSLIVSLLVSCSRAIQILFASFHSRPSYTRGATACRRRQPNSSVNSLVVVVVDDCECQRALVRFRHPVCIEQPRRPS